MTSSNYITRLNKRCYSSQTLPCLSPDYQGYKQHYGYFFFQHYWPVFTVTPFRRKVKSSISHRPGQWSTAVVAPFLSSQFKYQFVLPAEVVQQALEISSAEYVMEDCANSQNLKGCLKQRRYISKMCFHTVFMYVMVSSELPKYQLHLSWAGVVISFLLMSKFLMLKSKFCDLETYKAHNRT